MTEPLEGSNFTSIKERIEAIASANHDTDNSEETVFPTPEGLMPFVGGKYIDKERGIPFDITDYLELTEWTGKAIRDDKKGAIPHNLTPILERLKIAPDAWLKNIRYYNKNYYRAVGSVTAIKQYCEALGQQWLCGMKAAQQMYKAVPT